MPTVDLRAAIVMLLLVCAAPADVALGQEGGRPMYQENTLDRQLLGAVYRIDNPVFGSVMVGADLVAYPVFYGAVPAAWVGPIFLRQDDDYTDAYLLTLSFVGSYLTSNYLKKLIRRPRPMLSIFDDRGREHDRDDWENERYEFSMPSGHAAVAFTLATSYSLSHPEWYVIAPSFVWATSTAMSRVWRGRHFPSDVLVGMGLGIAIGGVLHLASPHITPEFLHE